MTMLSLVPVARYTANGVLTQYYWDWQMLPSSQIEVRVANLTTTAYQDNRNAGTPNMLTPYPQGGNIIFFEPPVAGAEIVIFRRTVLWQPEDYAKFRGFKADKTELTMDRITAIAQELKAGVVGAADIFLTLWGDGITVHSERGTDAFLPLWGSLIPDPSIIWAGADIDVNESTNNPLSISQIIFWAFNGGGQIGQSNAGYTNDRGTLFAGWLDFENPNPGEYWMRMREVANQIENGQELTIIDGDGTPRTFGDEFDPRNTVMKISTTNAVPPVISTIDMFVDICKDDGLGSPDGVWATRFVTMSLEYST